MKVLIITGSPRRKGNSAYLAEQVSNELTNAGATINRIHAPDTKIRPCSGCGVCEKSGFCYYKDEMTSHIYSLIRESDLVILATPVYFYGVPAELKALIDRTQPLWSRKYIFKLTDPNARHRKGLMLAVGATKGADLFDGVYLTCKYFFLGIEAEFTDTLSYSRVEGKDELKAKYPQLQQDVSKTIRGIMEAYNEQMSGLIIVTGPSVSLNFMAWAFIQMNPANRYRVIVCRETDDIVTASKPVSRLMAEKKIDIDFIRPDLISEVLDQHTPSHIISINKKPETIDTEAKTHYWTFDTDLNTEIRNAIEQASEDFVRENCSQ